MAGANSQGALRDSGVDFGRLNLFRIIRLPVEGFGDFMLDTDGAEKEAQTIIRKGEKRGHTPT